MEQESERWIRAASAVMWELKRPVVVKRKPSQNSKLSIYRSIYVPTLTYGNEPWVVTERMILWIQAAEMSFLPRWPGSAFTAPPHWEEPVEVVWASFQDASWKSPWGGVLGMFIWEETLGQDQRSAREIISLSWLRNILVSPHKGVSGSDLGEECLDLPAQAVSPATWTQVSGRKQNKTKQYFGSHLWTSQMFEVVEPVHMGPTVVKCMN